MLELKLDGMQTKPTKLLKSPLAKALAPNNQSFQTRLEAKQKYFQTGLEAKPK